MILKNPELLTDFYLEQKEYYPELTLEQFKDICQNPWRYTKREMEFGELPTIRLKYFGTLQVYPKRAKNMLENLKKRFKLHQIDSKQFFKLKEMLEKFLEKDENKIK